MPDQKIDMCFCGLPLNMGGFSFWQHSPACELYKPSPEWGHLGVATTGNALGKNGMMNVEAIVARTLGKMVHIAPVNTRHEEGRCWIELKPEDFDRLCQMWLESRGKLPSNQAEDKSDP